MNKNNAVQAFKDYTKNFDISNAGVALKISHTFRVAELAEKIALSIQDKNINPKFAWLLGLLHDVGRFEQVTKFGTFKDAFSVDHAELGADILFNEGLIEKFSSEAEGLEDDWKNLAEITIRLHNKLKVPDGLPKKTKIYADILRDADKTDIFRVATEPPYENDKKNFEKFTVRDEILQCVREHRCVPRMAVEANELESLVAQCCMAFEIVYPETKKIIFQQGYLKKLFDAVPLMVIREEFEKNFSV